MRLPIQVTFHQSRVCHSAASASLSLKSFVEADPLARQTQASSLDQALTGVVINAFQFLQVSP